MDEITSRLRQIPTWAVLAICCAAQFMVVLDVAIVNVALPQMRESLGLSVVGEQWVVNAYTLTFAGFLMLGGRAADLFGRRRVFIIGLTVFTVCSLIGGLAQSGAWLITARAAQGIGGAILAPATLSILVTTFTDPGERRRALGAWSATAASGAAVGVLAGGVLTSLLDWRWVLFVNVPIGIVLLAGAWVALPRSEQMGPRKALDLTGAVTVTAGLAVLVYGIVSTDVHPWGSARTLVTLAIGLALLAAFFVTETRFAKDPLIPLSIFKRRSLSVANGIAVTIGAAIFGTYFFLSLFLQNVDGYSPLRAGLAFLPVGLSTLAGALIGSRLVQVLGARNQLMVGPGLAAAGLLWLSHGGGRGCLPGARPRPGDAHRPGYRHVVRPHDPGGHGRRPRSRGGTRLRADQHHPADRRGPGSGHHGHGGLQHRRPPRVGPAGGGRVTDLRVPGGVRHRRVRPDRRGRTGHPAAPALFTGRGGRAPLPRSKRSDPAEVRPEDDLVVVEM